MERKNDLGLDTDDLANIDQVLEALMDAIAPMNANEYTEEHFEGLHDALGFANFVVAGIIYKHGMDLGGCDHDHDEDDDGVE